MSARPACLAQALQRTVESVSQTLTVQAGQRANLKGVAAAGSASVSVSGL